MVGASVAIAFIDRIQNVGGMCHFIYPQLTEGDKPSTLYARPATLQLLRIFSKSGSSIGALEAYIFGGATHPDANDDMLHVGEDNLAAADKWLEHYGVRVISRDVGGNHGRKVAFNTVTGEIVTDKVIAIGASTGGTEAIRSIITQFSAIMPGVIIVQHMPPGFTSMFAERLNDQCSMSVKEAEDGDRVMQGKVLIAPGDYHMEIRRSGGMYRVKLNQHEKVCGHRPSVEVLLNSVAKHVGSNALAIILTGMGNDGAEGMLAMHNAGSRTLAQDEASSVVFGMPKVAFQRGGVEKLVPLNRMAKEAISITAGMN